MNRRALARRASPRRPCPRSLGPQAYWTGGAGPTLVLLHGAGDSAGTWSSVVGRLRAALPRSSSPTSPGHGHSAPGRRPDLGRPGARRPRGRDAAGPAGPGHHRRQLPRRVGGPALRARASGPRRPPRARQRRRARRRPAGSQPDAEDARGGRRADDAVARSVGRAASPASCSTMSCGRRRPGRSRRLAQTAGEMGQYVLDGKLHEITRAGRSALGRVRQALLDRLRAAHDGAAPGVAPDDDSRRAATCRSRNARRASPPRCSTC